MQGLSLADIGKPVGKATAIALSWGDETMTYGELNAAIDAARSAYSVLAARPGDRVALLLPTGPEFVIAYFGALRAGLVVMPLNPLLGPEEIKAIVADMRPAVLLAAPADAPYPILPQLDEIMAGLATPVTLVRYGEGAYFDELLRCAPRGLPVCPRDDGGEAVILFTSGTSGRPKGVSHVQSALLANAHHANAVFAFDPRDVLLCPLPLSHVFGQMVMMLGGLMAGAELALVPRPTPAALLHAMVQRQPTMVAAVPTSFAALAELGRADSDGVRRAVQRLRFAFSGGAALPPPTADFFMRVFGIAVHQGYGMTEVACCIAIEAPSTPPGQGVGRLCTPLSYRIVPNDPAKPDEGELELSGPNIFRGYYVDGEWRPRAVEQWFATGDMVRIDQAGSLILYDRKKNMIIRNGYNVYPSEVEAVLTRHPDVVLAAVIAVPDPVVGEEIAAFVQLRDGAVLTADSLARWCRTQIALFKYPRLFAIVPVMPTNPTGKIMKSALNSDQLRRVDQR